MKKKITLYEEAAYFIGIILVAFGTALAQRADFGMSMVVAPAYLVHLKVSQYLPWFSFGVAEYTLQALLIILLAVITRQIKKGYFFSFVTAVIYGIILDGCVKFVALLPGSQILSRIIFFVAAILSCAIGIAFLFHTYLAPEAYELIVKDISSKYNLKISRVKTVYDVVSCILGVILSFAFFGMWHFVGISYGTAICAALNGFLIGRFSKILDKIFEMKKNDKLFKVMN